MTPHIPQGLSVTLIPEFQPTGRRVVWTPQLEGCPFFSNTPHNCCVPSLEVTTLPVDLKSKETWRPARFTVLPWAGYLPSLCLSFLSSCYRRLAQCRPCDLHSGKMRWGDGGACLSPTEQMASLEEGQGGGCTALTHRPGTG